MGRTISDRARQAYYLRLHDRKLWKLIAAQTGYCDASACHKASALYAALHSLPWPLRGQQSAGQRAYALHAESQLTWKEIEQHIFPGSAYRGYARNYARKFARRRGKPWPVTLTKTLKSKR